MKPDVMKPDAMKPDAMKKRAENRTAARLPEGEQRAELGSDMADFVRRAFPLCRSITGNGVRQTFDLLDRFFAPDLTLERTEVATGTPVLDWQVPKEWNLRRATIRDPSGQVIVDSDVSNLHVLNYSVPFEGSLDFEQLDEHLYSLPDRPTLVPYRTSYYQERWGFCLPHAQRTALSTSDVDGEYRVSIDSTLEDGSLSYAEIVLPGASEEEVLISAHCCHPSLCNDNLSGMIVAAAVARHLSATTRQHQRRYTCRVLFAPGTIGAITWLAGNEPQMSRIRGGLIAANLGYSHGEPLFHYKRSRRGISEIDRAVERALEESGVSSTVSDFVPFGYDERQYCSPGFDLPIGLLSRTPWGEYPQYHTSADDLSLLDETVLLESLDMYLRVLSQFEASSDPDVERSALRRDASRDQTRVLINLEPRGEPQLGSRGLYNTLGGGDEGRERQLALLWVLNLSDGRHSLGDIAQRSGMTLEQIEQAADRLMDAELVRESSAA